MHFPSDLSTIALSGGLDEQLLQPLVEDLRTVRQFVNWGESGTAHEGRFVNFTWCGLRCVLYEINGEVIEIEQVGGTYRNPTATPLFKAAKAAIANKDRASFMQLLDELFPDVCPDPHER